jgi:hypothetical protein
MPRNKWTAKRERQYEHIKVAGCVRIEAPAGAHMTNSTMRPEPATSRAAPI